jgi:hypothetical protein
LALKVSKALLDFKAPKEFKVLLVLKARWELLVPQVFKVSRVLKVLPDFKAPKEFKEQ